METKLYWTAHGTNYNSYNDGYLHKFKAVKGLKIETQLSNDFDLFTYSDDKNCFIVLKDHGISIVSGKTLQDALDKLNKIISDYDYAQVIKMINQKLVNSKTVPDTPPQYENEIIELDVYISMKTGEENLDHTKWVNRNKTTV